jgi:two-component system, LytTR family, sensor kinase
MSARNPFPEFLRSARFAAVNVGFWTAVSFLFAIQSEARTSDGNFGRSLLVALASFAPCLLLTPFIAILATRYRFAVGQKRQSVVAHLAGLSAFLVIGGGLMGAFAWLLPWLRTEDLLGAMGRAILVYIAMDALIYLMIAVAFMAYAYSRESQEQSVTAARLQAQLAETRLHVLSAQLQPHFLFNTLNAISAFVRDDPPNAERLLARLSDLLRHSLRDGASPETSLESEFAFLEKYVEVQEARFGPRLNVTFTVDPHVLDARVPRLILQPLVENAIRHGVAPRAGPGRVEVAARGDGDFIRLLVRDDGIGVPASGLREGVGLRTTRDRLKQLYGEQHEFALVSQPAGGTECRLRLPLRRSSTN